jgi:hypothetical protein
MKTQDMERLAHMVADIVVAKMGTGEQVKARRLTRLNIAQFAFCAQRSQEHIRRKIRGRVIPKNLVDGPPYLLDPKAFSIFGVSPEVALARLPLFTVPEQGPRPAESRQPSPA